MVEESLVLPVPVDVLGIFPHAHYVAKDLEIFAKLPNGEKQELLHTSDWDFFWQQTYRFEQPVRLPAGAEVVLRQYSGQYSESLQSTAADKAWLEFDR